jgi:hypothetical protein
MAHLRLPAGTDVAEMALFDTEALPASRELDGERLDELASKNRLIRFPTGGDGGYLLHLFVNEDVPPSIQRYCLEHDKLEGKFSTASGRIAFGGVESVHHEFKQNSNIRTDVTIGPGTYEYAAYRTDFPDELVTQASRVGRTREEVWLDRAPLIAVLSTIAIAVTLAVFQHYLFAGVSLAAGYFVARWLARRPTYLKIQTRRRDAQLDFPSMVIALRDAA